MSKLPLSRFKVIDLTRVRAGPTCVRQLADWGADVIKIEDPKGDGGLGGDRNGPDFQNIHRNKRSMTLDLKKPEGVAILKQLVAEADVLVENFRPDVKFRLGIDYESLKRGQSAPGLCQHLGLRPGRPLSRAPGLRPDRPGHGRADVHHRTAGPGPGARRHSHRRSHRRHLRRHGHSDRACWSARNRARANGCNPRSWSSQIAMLDFQAARWLVKHEVPGQAGNNHPTSIPTGVFPTKDGHINIATAGEELYRRLCAAIGRPDLAGRSRLFDGRGAAQEPRQAQRSDRQDHAGQEFGRMDRAANQGRRARGADLQDERGVRRSPGEAFENGAQGEASEARRDRAGRASGEPVAHALGNARVPRPSAASIPTQVLRELGYQGQDISRLRNEGVV